MKFMKVIGLFCLCSLFSSCQQKEKEPIIIKEIEYTIQMKLNDSIYTIQLIESETTKAFVQLLPLTIEMDELNGNEKYAYLNNSLPVNEERVNKIEIGDFMLYQSNCLVLFYDQFDTNYSYTRLGSIIEEIELDEFMNNDSIDVTFIELVK